MKMVYCRSSLTSDPYRTRHEMHLVARSLLRFDKKRFPDGIRPDRYTVSVSNNSLTRQLAFRAAA